MDLNILVARYQLALGGIKVWTPYWINLDEPPYRLDAPYRGKGTPGQVKAALARSLAGQSLASARSYRTQMRQLGLGIDCSGFVYDVLDQYLRALSHKSLAHQLVVPKSEILAALAKPSWQRTKISDKELAQWPDLIPLSQVCHRWHKSSRQITNVARLVHSATSNRIERARDIRPGDLIKMTSSWGDHIAIVTSVSPDQLVYASSDESWGDDAFGGPRLSKVSVHNPQLGLEVQTWPHRSIFHPEQGDAVWRLTALHG